MFQNQKTTGSGIPGDKHFKTQNQTAVSSNFEQELHELFDAIVQDMGDTDFTPLAVGTDLTIIICRFHTSRLVAME
jgi:hypothetical protein